MSIVFAAMIAMSSFKQARVVRVYDGDTFTVTLAGQPYVFGYEVGVRVKGIDTPEMTDSRDCMKKEAKESKETLIRLIGMKRVDLHHCERDKYFRILCNVKTDDVDVGSYMLEQGNAVPYAGETKMIRKCR